MTSDYKVLGQAFPLATTLTDCYTVPTGKQTVSSTITVCNQGAGATSFRLAIAPAGAADSSEQYVAYDVSLDGNASDTWTIGVTLDEGDVVRVYAADATVSFNVFGEEMDSSAGGGGFAIGSSYLEATNPGDDNLANGAVNIDWTLSASAGSDVSINGGAANEIDIATTGVYSISFRAEAFTETANGLYSVFHEIRKTTAVGTLLLDNGFRIANDVDTVGDYEQAVVIPAYRATAGDKLFFRLSGLNSDSDWGYSNVQLKIMRLG